MNKHDFSAEISKAASISIDWSRLDDRAVLITGATGLIGKYLIEVLLERNRLYNKNTHIIAMGRDYQKFAARFSDVKDWQKVEFVCHNVIEPLQYEGQIDFIVHLASNTHPRLYATNPIDTELANVLGTMHLLNLAATKENCRFVLASSGDIYGDNRSEKEYLDEKDCGYIDCNTLRAAYIEGKRAAEALCNGYLEEKKVDFVIARFCRLYGRTMQQADSKAISQFIKKAAAGEDIVLKSEGLQTFSYLYIYDAVTALLTIMLNGQCGNAYNVADNSQVCSLKQLAQFCADAVGSKVVFELPEQLEAKGASTFQNVRLDGRKLKALGWNAEVDMQQGLRKTIIDLREELC